MDSYEQYVWVYDGERCYTKVIHKWRLNADGTTEVDGRVVRWEKFK